MHKQILLMMVILLVFVMESPVSAESQDGGAEAVSPVLTEPFTTEVAIQEAEPEQKTFQEKPVQEGPSSWASWLAVKTIAPAGKILITGMRAEKNEFEIIATEPIRDYKFFTLTQPSRLVVDIANGESGFILDKVIINRLGIATVRFESFPDYLRIFFDAGRMIPYRIVETARGLKIIVTSP